MVKRYSELFDKGHNEPQRTSEEIIATITKQLEEMTGKEETQNECI